MQASKLTSYGHTKFEPPHIIASELATFHHQPPKIDEKNIFSIAFFTWNSGINLIRLKFPSKFNYSSLIINWKPKRARRVRTKLWIYKWNYASMIKWLAHAYLVWKGLLEENNNIKEDEINRIQSWNILVELLMICCTFSLLINSNILIKKKNHLIAT